MKTLIDIMLSEASISTAIICLFIIGFTFLLKHILNEHKADRRRWLDIIREQNKIIGNHIDHLTKSNNKVVTYLKKHDTKTEFLSKQIVNAINNQTEIMKAWRSNNG